MILRPVRPVSAFGPPTSNRPVGFTRIRTPSVVSSGNSRSTGSIDLGLDVGPQEGFDVDLFPVLRADQHGVDPRWLAVHVLDRDLTLAVRTEVGNDPRLADVGQTPGETVREGDRQRHQLVRLVAGVAEHHPLVAGAQHVERVLGMLLTLLEGVLHPDRDVGRLLLDRGDDATGVAVQPEPSIGVADVNHRVRERSTGCPRTPRW